MITYLIHLFVLFVLYLVTARFGLSVEPIGGFATLIWLPTGISLAALLVFGIKLWPAVFMGAFVANFLTGASIPVALAMGCGNALESVVAFLLLRKFAGFRRSLERLRDVVALVVLGAFFSTTISASVGVTSLLLGNVIKLADFGITWFSWWVGDLISVLTIVPLALICSRKLKDVNYRIMVEFAVILLILFVLVFIIFTDTFPIASQGRPVTYLIFIPLIYICLRFTQREIVTTIFLLSLATMSFTAIGKGPFATGSLSENLLFLQMFISVISITSLVLGAVMAERRLLSSNKDDLFNIVSHELKNPLTVLTLQTQMLLKILAGHSKQVNYLGNINGQINKIVKIANDFLDLSKMQSGRFVFSNEYFNLREIIDDISKNATILYTERLVFINQYDCLLYGDKEKIGQVLMNLVDNAIKYSPDKKPVTISTHVLKNKVIVKVSDHGTGIPKEYTGKVFEKYFRVDGNEITKKPGTGIGLYLAREVIKSHGGDIWFDSKEGVGTIFSVSLPKMSTQSRD